MANISRRPNGTWRARYRDLSGRQHARHFGRKVDAQTWLDSITAAVQTGIYVDPAKAKVTVGVETRGIEPLTPALQNRPRGGLAEWALTENLF